MIAINFNIGTKRMMFFHWHNTSSFQYNTNRELDVYNTRKLPLGMLGGDEDNLINSGVIAQNDTHTLIEIGDTPWLLTVSGEKVSEYIGSSTQLLTTFNKAQQLSRRVSSIEAAMEQGRAPEGAVSICDVWWADPMLDQFTPPDLDPEIVKVVAVGLNPMDFGFTIDECTVSSLGYGSDSISFLTPAGVDMSGSKKNQATDSRETNYIKARTAWETAISQYTGRTPIEYKGIHCRSQRYNTSSRSKIGQILRTTKGVFIKGKFRAGGDWNKESNVGTWHKLNSLCNVVQMGG
jgi:hypothetical protein